MPAKKTSKKAAAPRAGRKPAGGRKRAKKSAKIGAASGTVFLINIIPKALSAETNQDSEPHLTVDPAAPKKIVGSAFTPDPSGGPNAPIFISNDGGNTWTLNSIVPSAAGSGSGTGDITTGFNRKAGKLYGAILRVPTGNQEFLRTNNFAAPASMTIIASRADADQPFTHVRTVKVGPLMRDRVYIGNNDFAAPGGKTATIDQSLDGGNSPFAAIRVEKRSTVGQDGPQVRPASNSDGTVYAAFYRWLSLTGSFPANTLVITSADVVVVRDDKGGTGTPSNRFTDLVDPSDGLPGRRVVTGVSFPFNRNGTPATGQQRLGGSLSIAVDPNNSSVVYLAWCDKQPTSMLTLHVRRSTDRGQTWSATDLLKVEDATNAALAVNSHGKVGLLFQQLRGLPGNPRWVTRLMRSADGVNWSDLILANVSATVPAKIFDPYIGDYDHLVAVGKDFYGIFSANNTPDTANFPNGVKYQRNADFATRKLLRLDNTTPVSPSIDPFFFKVIE